MELQIEALAKLIGGSVEGNGKALISSICDIRNGQPGGLAFLADDKYIPYLYQTKASGVIVSQNLVLEHSIEDTCSLIRVENPRIAIAILLQEYKKMQLDAFYGIDPSADIDKGSVIGKNVYIGPNVSISSGVEIQDDVKIYANVTIGRNTKIGKGCIIYSGATVYHDIIIGDYCTLQSGCIIGSDGFGFAPNTNNQYQKIIHIGNVVLEDHVEIGANTCIDRGTIGSTLIKTGVKLDNLIQVAHNVEIGENTVIAAQTGIAGSAKIGKNCMIGGQVGIVGHIEIADEVKIAAQSGIGSSIKTKGKIVQGSPAFEIGDYKRSYVLFKGLPELKRRLDDLLTNN